MGRAGRGTVLALVLIAAQGCSPVGHYQRLASFTATLAAQDSATAALEQWCATRQIASPATVTAEVRPLSRSIEPADARGLLALGPAERIGYRHVRLACGATVLSEAHNWYVPDRLTPAMNQALDTTRVPFGKATAPLGWRRERIGTLPRGSHACPRGTILAHRALLRLPDGRPLALLVECYTRDNVRGKGPPAQ